MVGESKEKVSVLSSSNLESAPEDNGFRLNPAYPGVFTVLTFDLLHHLASYFEYSKGEFGFLFIIRESPNK